MCRIRFKDHVPIFEEKIVTKQGGKAFANCGSSHAKGRGKRILGRKRNYEPCSYCGEKATTVDHIVPRSSGILDPNNPQNFAASCFKCNQDKGDMSLLEFLYTRKFGELKTSTD